MIGVGFGDAGSQDIRQANGTGILPHDTAFLSVPDSIFVQIKSHTPNFLEALTWKTDICRKENIFTQESKYWRESR